MSLLLFTTESPQVTVEFDSDEFCAAVIESFGFLIERYGYAPRTNGQDSVKFAKDELEVEVFREPMSYMIYVQVIRETTHELYVLGEILKALVPEKKIMCQCCGDNAVKMRECLSHLSEICQQNLRDILVADEAVFRKIADLVERNRDLYDLKSRYRSTRSNANLAWERKDWDTARRLYEEALPILSASEKRRLDFLIRKKT